MESRWFNFLRKADPLKGLKWSWQGVLPARLGEVLGGERSVFADVSRPPAEQYCSRLLSCVSSLAVSVESWLHQLVMVCNGNKVGPAHPRELAHSVQLQWGHLHRSVSWAFRRLLPRSEALLRLWHTGGRFHSGCLCLWVTANSGFQKKTKLPVLWVQIRNLQHPAVSSSA